jgi:Mg2+/citrate symporter
MEININEVLALLIPIIAIVMGIGIAFFAVFLDYSKRKRLMELYHQQRMAAIDKGIEMPPMPLDLLTADPRRRTRSSPLLRGLIWLFAGATLVVALYAGDLREKAFFGLIPAGIGAAYLIYYFAEGKKLAAEERAKELSETKPPVPV